MTKKINPEYPIVFFLNFYETGSIIVQRGLMTPSYLSTLIMLMILPAQTLVNKYQPLSNDDSGFCSVNAWYQRENPMQARYLAGWKNKYYNTVANTHTFRSLSFYGLETLEAKQKNQDLPQEYEIYCCGNAQDAMYFSLAYQRIGAEPNKNHIFWNYPGVGCSLGRVNCADDLFQAAYLQVKRLIVQGIPAQNITLHGFSLGGGVATHVARQLHEQGHQVNLSIERSFARMALVIPAMMKQQNIEDDQSKPNNPLKTSVAALAILGVALGTTFAGFLASAGLITASIISDIGYITVMSIEILSFISQKIIEAIGMLIAFPFSFFSESIGHHTQYLFNIINYYLSYLFYGIAFVINQTCLILALFIDKSINVLASLVGALIAISGFVAGTLTGLILGAILSFQLLWTNNPLTLPVTAAFSAVLYSSCCEMDSVNEIHQMFKADNNPENITNKQAKLSVINVLNDPIIRVGASLGIGLGFKPWQTDDDENNPLKEKISSFWYRGGKHNYPLDGLIESHQSFSR